MGIREKEFREKLSGLLGHYTKDEQEFIAKVNNKSNLSNGTKCNIIPEEKEMQDYVERSLKSLYEER